MNIHIVIKKGQVVAVYDLSHPDVEVKLDEGFDYKVEYPDDYENMEKDSK
jgi:hypothetical protein